jgi:hypothetical protein
MMKKIVVPGFLLSLVFVSCTDFFTTSWGEWAARNPANLIPKVTAGNVQELVDMAENNPDLSLEVLKKIGAAVGGASGGDKTKLQNAAVAAALNASDLTGALMNNASNVSNLEDPEQVKDLISNTLNGMDNLGPASDALTAILAQDTEAFKDSASADDLAMAAALILAGEAKKADNADLFDDLDNATIPPESQAAVDLAKDLAGKAAEKYDAGGGDNSVLKDLLDKLGLTPPPSPGS